ncbi:DUF1634 domain-containing protein [[Clostridium] cellulosi]|jgi:Protein of unknown function (DUF1634).|nr:MAG: DUF1634 domain-containing protein [[Clostridium] cellulosi]
MRNKEIEDLELAISKVIKYGVLASAAIMLIGLIIFLVTGSSGYPGSYYPTSLVEIFQGLIAFKPYAIMMFGLFLLILTPVLRVGVSILLFLKEKDYTFVRITTLVFIILIISFLLGKAK